MAGLLWLATVCLPAAGVLGDLDGDVQVTAADRSRLAAWLAGNRTGAAVKPDPGDLDSDSFRSAADLVLLQRKAGGAVGYRDEMRWLVRRVSALGRSAGPGFHVVPQNGQELFTDSGTGAGAPVAGYLAAIDGTGREDLWYGYDADDVATPPEVTAAWVGLLDVGEAHGVQALAIDYCRTRSFMDNSYAWNEARSYIAFAADRRELDDVPAYPAEPSHVNAADVTSLAGARNFLYLINPSAWEDDREGFLNALRAARHDLLVVDTLFNDGTFLTVAEVQSLKTKPGGGRRRVLAYFCIGEAEDYRWYWQPAWTSDPPAWLLGENPDWPGNYTVKYWYPEWQSILLDEPDGFLPRILAAGFDGVYLDLVDAFQLFE